MHFLEHGAIEGVIAEDENDHLATVEAIRIALKRDLELLTKKSNRIVSRAV